MELTDITRAFSNGDFARPNLFKVEIPSLGANFEFKCKAASMPAASVEKVPIGYQNKKINLAGDRTFDDWTITCYNDEAHDTRQQFIDWQALAQALDRNISGEAPDSYKKVAYVSQLDRKGEVTRTYTINGIWPTTVNELQLDWEQNSEVEKFEVVMSLDWWE
ncbi:MAG: phage tail protein [Culicoidibacterales bacterium]